jgi:hypothetical protein
MIQITIFNRATGQIQRIVVCDEASISYQYDANTYNHLVGVFADDKYYIENGVAILIPVKPSENHTFNYTTKQWEDPRTLQDIKDAQWALIKQSRTLAEYSGFTWDGSTFDSDAISQNRITGAVTLAQLSPSFTIDWTLRNNTVRTLGQTDMLQVGAALGVHVQTQFTKGQALRAQIYAATTVAEVEAVVWY